MTKSEMIELLTSDVPAWNKWRGENPEEAVDLAKADLKEADLA